MILKNISRGGLLFALILLTIPTTTFGYYTTGQSAIKVTSQTALYTVTYSFGIATKDIYLPVTTQRGLSFNDGDDAHKVGYSLTPTSEGSQGDGVAVGLVLSDLPIVDNMYKIEAGHRGQMTLVVLLTTDTDGPMAKYALQVDKLPFIVESADGTKENRELNNHELEKYVTDKIGLNKLN